MAKTFGEVDLRVRVKVVPCDGFEIRTFGRGEYLVVNTLDNSRNVILDSGTVAQLVGDHLAGVVLSEFNRGFGTFWRVEGVSEA